MKRATDFATYMESFMKHYLPQQNMQPNTFLSYYDTFTLLLVFMRDQEGIPAEKLLLKDFTHSSIERFLKYLKDERCNSPSTCNVRLSAIHSFFRYLQYECPVMLPEWQRILGIKFMKAPKKMMSYTSTEGMKLILSLPDQHTEIGRRDLALMALLYDTAARVTEICDFTPSSIHFAEPCTVKIIGKGNKARIVPMRVQQLEILKTYMAENQLLEASANKYPLFPNKHGTKLTRQGVGKILRKYVDVARLQRPDLIPETFSCHCVRHTGAMIMLQADIPLVYIRDFLGHTSTQTTEIYCRADSKMKREALAKVYANAHVSEMAPKWEKDRDMLKWLMNFGQKE